MELQEELTRLIQQVGTKEDNQKVINSINDEIKEIVAQFKQLEERINNLQLKKQECNNNIFKINSLEEKINNGVGKITDEQMFNILADMFNKYSKKNDGNEVDALNQIRLMIIEKYILNSMYRDENDKYNILSLPDKLKYKHKSQEEIEQYKRDIMFDLNQIGFLRQFISCSYICQKAGLIEENPTIGGLSLNAFNDVKKGFIEIIEKHPTAPIYAEVLNRFKIICDNADNYYMDKSVAEKFYKEIILPYYKEIGIPFSYNEEGKAVIQYPEKETINLSFEDVFNIGERRALNGYLNKNFSVACRRAIFLKHQNEKYNEDKLFEDFYINECDYSEDGYNTLKSNFEYENDLSTWYVIIVGDKEISIIDKIIKQNEYGKEGQTK